MVAKQIEILNERGIELNELGWTEEALGQFKKAIDLDPSYAPAYDNIANLYAERGNYLLALQIYLKAIELEPDNATVRYNFGCFMTNYATEIALLEYQEAIYQDPQFPEAHFNLGLSLAANGRLHEAVQELKITQVQDPSHAEAHYELARIFLKTHKLKRAILELRQAIQKNPNLACAWQCLGTCYTQQGFHEEARFAFHKAFELDPNLSHQQA